MEVIPAINCSDEGCVRGVLERASGFLPEGSWLHLDIADGRFTFHRTWNDPAAWARFGKAFALEVHLMVEDPESYIPAWLAAGARRFIVHYESFAPESGEDALLARTKSVLDLVPLQKASVLLGFNPETPVEPAVELVGLCAGAQMLAVAPGLSGQKFLPTVLGKLRFLRQRFPNATLEVDGGITPATALLTREAGANMVVSASAIFGSTNPGAVYREFCRI